MADPVRTAVLDHLRAFGRYSRGRVHHVNLALRGVPRHVRKTAYDLIILHTSLLSQRWSPERFAAIKERASPLANMQAGTRVAIPQDEFLHSDLLCDFLEALRTDVVFSAAPPTEWHKIYAPLIARGVDVHQVLTGYLDPGAVERMARAAATASRKTDIVYRAWHAAAWLGRHGQLKHELASRVDQAAAARGLVADISTSEHDVLYGDDWYALLASGKYTIGVEGGASILDHDGSVKDCTESYLVTSPGADFDTLERNCFAGRDGELQLFALSPRHLEACATRTCQILVEGSYNGVLSPWRHYLPVRRDLSNLSEVLDVAARDEDRAEIVQRAFDDVVASGRYSYERFVRDIEVAALGETVKQPARSLRSTGRLILNRLFDRLTWLEMKARLRAPRGFQGALRGPLRRLRA